MNGLPTWLRVWLAGMLWGTVCGVATALTVVAVLVLSGVGEDGFYWDGMYDFVAGLLMASMFGCIYGAVIGFVIGFFTGLVAGPGLEVALWLLAPKSAVPATVAFVLLIQFSIGVALTGDAWWVNLVIPAISALPMWFVMLRIVVEPESMEHIHRRDTLAA